MLLHILLSLPLSRSILLFPIGLFYSHSADSCTLSSIYLYDYFMERKHKDQNKWLLPNIFFAIYSPSNPTSRGSPPPPSSSTEKNTLKTRWATPAEQQQSGAAQKRNTGSYVLSTTYPHYLRSTLTLVYCCCGLLWSLYLLLSSLFCWRTSIVETSRQHQCANH